MNNPSGRRLALLVLDRIETNASYANLALQEILRTHGEPDRRERAFCTELVYGTLRHLLKIDFILGRLLSRPLKSLKTSVRNTLRLALYQLIFLPEIPERAVCHTAVDLIKNSKYSGLANLVNGVLRTFLRTKNNLITPDPALNSVEYLAVEYSHPEWLVRRWLDRFGTGLTGRILQVDNEQPPLTLRVNPLRAPIAQFFTEMEQLGMECSPGLFLPEAVTIRSLPEALEDWPVFQAGRFFVQDESSMLVAHLLKPLPGETIVDLCAAPGGKSTHLAELISDHGIIYSVDNHPHKVQLVLENAQRLKVQSVKPVLADARQFSLPAGIFADAVLVDAPCSGTGVLRRRIDLRYRRQPEEIGQLTQIQQEILTQASSLVRPGGRLIYSTCTLESEENESQIQWFLRNHPNYEIEDFRGYLPTHLANYLADHTSKWATILPISAGGDGFFMCRLTRRG